MAQELLGIATGAESDSVRLTAIRDALDRGGVTAKSAVELSATREPAPWEEILADIAGVAQITLEESEFLARRRAGLTDGPTALPTQETEVVDAELVPEPGDRDGPASCGHGGGASYLVRTLHPASYTGLDLNPAGIEFCRKRHNLAGLDFVEGNAENLPSADQSLDAVLNVEASHLYPDFPRFLAEVARVLAPGGHFLYADFRRRQGVAEWEAALADVPMRELSCAVIDAGVLRGNEKNSPRKHNLISRHGSAIPRGFARYASDVTDWAFNGALQRGEFTYRVYCFAKD